MSLSSVSAKDYEEKSNPTLGENKPNSNPIQSQTKPIWSEGKMGANISSTRNYVNNPAERLLQNKPNSKPIQTQLPKSPRMDVSSSITEDYDRQQRTINNEPNSTQTQPVVSLHALSQAQGSNLFQARRAARIPTRGVPGRPERPAQLQDRTARKSFLFFTLVCPNYNLPMQTWTIQKLLNWVTEYLSEKGIESPRLSAELLLSHVLDLKRIELYTQFDRPVAKQQLDILHDLVRRAGQDEPVAYLTGKTEFYSLELNVTRDCLIPRPETELLVERAIEFLRLRAGNQFVCDLCTGCGCIAVAIAKNFPAARIIATDISDAALNTAAANVEKHQLQDRVELLRGDLFDPIVPHLDVDKLAPDSDRGLDLIVCNPPYISATEYPTLDKNVQDYEPESALLAGVDGLNVYRRIVERADQFLKHDAALMLEIGYAQGVAVRELLEQAGIFAEVKIEKDFHNNDRIATARKKMSL